MSPARSAAEPVESSLAAKEADAADPQGVSLPVRPRQSPVPAFPPVTRSSLRGSAASREKISHRKQPAERVYARGATSLPQKRQTFAAGMMSSARAVYARTRSGIKNASTSPKMDGTSVQKKSR